MLQEVGEIYEADGEFDAAVDALQQAAEYLAVSWGTRQRTSVLGRR